MATEPRAEEEPVADDLKTYTIELRQDGQGNSYAYLAASDGGSGISGGWASTPEAALIQLCEKGRAKLTELGGTSTRSVKEDGNVGLYIWLSKAFR